MAAGETLVVLATDPEAPIDLAALAADEGHRYARERAGDGWRLTLTKAAVDR
jgi:TusA-related sulfurtransferase